MPYLPSTSRLMQMEWVVSNPVAMTLSGTAPARAFTTASKARKAGIMRARTGAGGRGLSRLPYGAVTAIGRASPWLNGMSGELATALTAASAADTVEAKGQFRLSRT